MTLSSPGAFITSPNFSMKKTMKTIKQVDKDTEHMYREHGTVCLVTEPGRTDRLLDLAHQRRVKQERYVRSPLDAWDI